MSRALALLAGPRPPPRIVHGRAEWGPFLLSAGLHGLALVGALTLTVSWWHRLPEPTDPPQIDVVLDGGGKAVTGKVAEMPAPPPSPAAALPPVPLPPTQAFAPLPPAELPPQAVPEPSPPPQTAGLLPVAPALPPPVVQQPAPPPPPPTTMASLAAPPVADSEEAPEIRLGDGVAGPMAELMKDGGFIRRAQAANGNMPPGYPLDAARRGEHGTVRLRMTIGTDGAVLAAAVAKSSGSPRLDRAAQEQMATWHFTPAMRNGKPQIDVIEMEFEFVLD